MSAALRVLIANGDVSEREAIAATLADLDADVEVAVALRDIARSVAEAPPDVVIIPGPRARTVIEAVRDTNASPTIIVAIGTSSEALMRQHLAAGADHVVRLAPGNPELRDTVRALAKLPRQDPRGLRQLAIGTAADLEMYLDAAVRLGGDDDESPVRRLIAGARNLARSLTGYVRGDSTLPTLVDLRAVVRDAARVVEAVVTDAEVIIDEGPQPAIVRGHASELAQLSVHLLLVALASSRALVRVRVAIDGDDTVLEVSDAGGAAAGAPSPESAGERGIPAGSLATVRAVLQRHRAHLFIAPRDSGGTTIRVVIPKRP
jgi:signal transduction histidine kinase|nr:hypothetical protein [Kofleriaceae bacterium]